MFSSGIASWAAAKRVVAQHGPADVTLLFADTGIEDQDNYRFLDEAAANVGVPVTRLADGRTPWQVFHDERFLGNARVDPCSRVLKREVLDRWRDQHCTPEDAVVYIGLDWTEGHRLARLQQHVQPWIYQAPLMAAPYLSKRDMLAWAEREGLTPPRLYALGFPHANCGGFCIKAGQAQFALLLRVLPHRYAEHEDEEGRLRERLGKDVAILRDRTGGTTTPLTMRAFRERLESGGQADLFEWGGCGCMTPADDSERA